MFQVSHFALILISGGVWLAVGCFLLPLGLNLIVALLLDENSAQARPVLNFFAPYVGGLESSALFWISLALVIGALKGRFVFSKSVHRSVSRILTLPNPAKISKIYTPGYYLLLGSMVFLGILVRYTTQDIRGGVDIAIGSALISGSLLYFHRAWLTRKEALM